MSSHYPSMEAWDEWKKRCSVSLCSDKARSEITGFVARTMAKRWREPYNGMRPAKLGADRDRELVQLFEVTLHVERKKKKLHLIGAKRWKDWLFVRAGSDRIKLGSLAARVVRTTVYRNFRREELGCVPAVDFSTLVHETGTGQEDDSTEAYQRTVDRLLGDAGKAAAPELLVREERLKAGKGHAMKFFAKMRFEERIVMLGIALGLKPYGAEVLKSAGKSASTLQERIEGRKGDAKLANVPVPSRKKLWLRVRDALPRPTAEHFGKEGIAEIATWALAQLPEVARAWGEHDPACTALFAASDK